MATARALLVLACGLIAMVAPSAASAAAIYVNTTADVVANDGRCSLREAIAAANTRTPSGSAPGECPAGAADGNTIALPAGQLALMLGELSISSQITVIGGGEATTTVSANGTSRLFDVLPGASLTVAQATLTGGHAPNGMSGSSSTPGRPGGAGGAIDSAGSLTLQYVTLDSNYAGDGGAGSTAQSPGPGGSGGAIESTGPLLTIMDSTIAQNSAGTGGSAASRRAGAAGGSGGGIDATGGQITITDSTIDDNAAGNGGRAPFLGGPAGNGGGLSLANPAPLTVINSTIANNHGGHAGSNLPPAGSFSTGGALVQNGGTATLAEVTVAGNTEDSSYGTPRDISTTGSTTISDSALDGTCSTQVTDGGHNVALSGGGCPGAPANAQNGSPAFDLGPLQDNGGPTETMLPSASSALIDVVPVSGAGCQPGDQRGVGRPRSGACDAGAVERRPMVVLVLPSRRRFGAVQLGHPRLRRVSVLYADGEGSLDFAGARITGRNHRFFRIVRNGCRNTQLEPDQACTLVLSFRPRSAGLRRATLIVAIQSLGNLTIRLVGRGLF